MDILLKLYKRLDIEQLLIDISNLCTIHKIQRIFVHIDYSNEENKILIIKLIKKYFKDLNIYHYVSAYNLGCTKAHYSALDFAYTLPDVNNLMVIEDDLIFQKNPLKDLILPDVYSLFTVKLSFYYWAFIVNKITYEKLKNTDLLSLDISDNKKELLLKMQELNTPLTWDTEMDLKIKFIKPEISVFDNYCFKGTGVPSTRSTETPVYITKTIIH